MSSLFYNKEDKKKEGMNILVHNSIGNASFSDPLNFGHKINIYSNGQQHNQKKILSNMMVNMVMCLNR